jgi:F-type H+-transporting ATPase subunit b
MYILNSFTIIAETLESAGGLFDISATLPVMALQIVLLTLALNIVFYSPISEVLENRSTHIADSLKSAASLLDEAELLSKEYEEKLLAARTEAKEILTSSKEEAQNTVRLQVEQAQKDTATLIGESNKQLNIEKENALTILQDQVEFLSEQIRLKILIG